MNPRRFFLLCILLLLIFPVHGQTAAPAAVDEAALEKKRSTWYPKEKEAKPQQDQVAISDDPSFDFNFPKWLRVLLLLVLVALGLGVVIYYVLKNPLVAKTSKSLEAAVEESAEIADDALDEALEAALSSGNHTLVIRYTYLYLLRGMEAAGWIVRHPHKTNHTYYLEIQNVELANAFSKKTRQFEDVWYGQYPVHGGAADAYYQEIKQWVQRMPKNKTELHA